MLSYRHAFHAGNHADVLKHLVLVLTLEHLLQKADKPFMYLDTHAGPGDSHLAEAMALKTAEFREGIGRLWSASGLPAPLARYVETVRGFNPDGELSRYPGSPAIARRLMTVGRLELCELHPNDHRQLSAWAGTDRRIHVHREDGFEYLKACLPPRERRALVLLDPPYEMKDDYRRVVDGLRGALKRFATGVYLAWYPVLSRAEARALPGAFETLSDRWLRVEFAVTPPAEQGMTGSGVFVINPPWRLAGQLAECTETLGHLLCDTRAGGMTISGPG